MPPDKKLEFVFQHGFGFDSTSWSAWLDLTTELEPKCIIHLGERGYFGTEAHIPDFRSDSQSTKVIVSHSLGLHLLPDKVLAAADVIISVGGFLSFHPQDQSPDEKHSRAAIKAMLRKLRTSPAQVLHDFYMSCFGDILGPPNITNVNIQMPGQDGLDRLIEDLTLLDTAYLKPAILEHAKVIFIHGKNDRVVPLAKAYEAHREVHGSELYTMDGADHALPFTHAASMWLILRQQINHHLSDRQGKCIHAS